MKQKNTVKRFNNIRDPILNNVNDLSAQTPVQTNGSGTVTGFVPLAPMGLSTYALTGGTTSAPQYTVQPVENARLPWLWNTARNFEQYRVLRATLVFVGNVGSTTPGKIYFSSSVDYTDDIAVPTVGTMSGGKQYPLSLAATKEIRFQLDVDSAWKKAANYTTILLAGGLATVNTINDLMFSSFSWLVLGGPNSTLVGNFYLEYDVEFKSPISVAVNF